MRTGPEGRAWTSRRLCAGRTRAAAQTQGTGRPCQTGKTFPTSKAPLLDISRSARGGLPALGVGLSPVGSRKRHSKVRDETRIVTEVCAGWGLQARNRPSPEELSSLVKTGTVDKGQPRKGCRARLGRMNSSYPLYLLVVPAAGGSMALRTRLCRWMQHQ